MSQANSDSKTTEGVSKIKPGDVLCFEHMRRNALSTVSAVTVTKVGRKWFETSLPYIGRFDVNTLESGSDTNFRHNVGIMWRSREERDAHRARENAWRELKRLTNAWGPPKGISTKAIEAAINLLKASST